MIYEALCRKCGETFNPHDETDLIHYARISDGKECGGSGDMKGEWLPDPNRSRQVTIMDPDEVLRKIRAITEDHYDSEIPGNVMDELVGLIDALDQWITTGGFLPSEWKDHGAGSGRYVAGSTQKRKKP